MEPLNRPPNLYAFFFSIIDFNKNTNFCLLFLYWIQEPLIDLRLFLETNVFCYLFS